MAKYIDHCYDTKKKLGEECGHIHRYMDQYFKRYGVRHRHKLHHWEGIEKCARFTEATHGGEYIHWYQAAKFHVQMDFEVGSGLLIPHIKDYIGGDGDWPAGPAWNNAPWDVSVCDKNMLITEEIVAEVKKELRGIGG